MPLNRIIADSITDGTIVAADIADGTITNAKIVSVANTKITGNIISSQITSVANTQITGNIISSQITSVANTQITGNIASSQITSNPTLYGNVSVTGVIGVGGATPSTSGSGITFPATQNASGDANTLDDYEEGTYTPVITGSTSGGPFTFGTQSGYYTKIGREVKVSMFMSHNSTVTFSGAYKISLPFATADYGGGGFVSYMSGWSTQSPKLFQIEASTTYGFLRGESATDQFDLLQGYIGNNTSFMLTILYKTS